MKQLLCLPIRLCLGVVEILGRMAIQVLCYVAGPFLWFIGACFLFSVFRQEWFHCGLLALCGAVCVLGMLGAGWVIALAGILRDWLK